MVDIPGNSSTTAGIVVGGTVTGSLEVVGDHDWFRITLEAGQTVTITLNGTTLEDPYLRGWFELAHAYSAYFQGRWRQAHHMAPPQTSSAAGTPSSTAPASSGQPSSRSASARSATPSRRRFSRAEGVGTRPPAIRIKFFMRGRLAPRRALAQGNWPATPVRTSCDPRSP